MAGGIQFNVKLNRFPQAPDLMRKAIASGLADAGTVILADMQRRTPVDTGELRNSETATVEGETQLRLTAGTDHAWYVHDGTRYMAARPFMRLAVEAAGPTLERALTTAFAAEFGG